MIDQAQGLRDFVQTLNARGFQIDAKPVTEETFEDYLAKLSTPQADILLGLGHANSRPVESYPGLNLASFGGKE